MDMFITLIMVMYHGCMPKLIKLNIFFKKKNHLPG
jgi:hypothetical protein